MIDKFQYPWTQDQGFHRSIPEVLNLQHYLETLLIRYIRDLDDLTYTIHTPKHALLFKNECLSAKDDNLFIYPTIIFGRYYILPAVTQFINTVEALAYPDALTSPLSHDEDYCPKLHDYESSLLFPAPLHTEVVILNGVDTMDNRLRTINKANIDLEDVLNIGEYQSTYNGAIYKDIPSQEALPSVLASFLEDLRCSTFDRLMKSDWLDDRLYSMMYDRIEYIEALVNDKKVDALAVSYVKHICSIMLSASYLYSCITCAFSSFGTDEDVIDFVFTIPEAKKERILRYLRNNL